MIMNPVEKILKEHSIIILDGALATELERRGYDINDSLWSAKILAENPEQIKNIHYDYFAAGADCAITSSYQATIEGFLKRGFDEKESVELIKKSVEIAKEARDEFWAEEVNRKGRPYPLVAASVGPYGAYLADGSEYRGDYNVTERELMDFHRERMRILIEAGADILACETIPNMIEANAIVKLLKEFEGVYAWISFSCKNDLEISDGTLISECTKMLDSYKEVVAIGVNCTAPEYIPSLISEVRNNSKKPVVVYPNSGEEYDPGEKEWHGHSTGENYGCSSRIWYENGASLIGGCCRTTPEDIKAVSKWARNL